MYLVIDDNASGSSYYCDEHLNLSLTPAIRVSDIADRAFDLGKMKSSNKWHIRKYGNKSYCNSDLIGQTTLDSQKMRENSSGNLT